MRLANAIILTLMAATLAGAVGFEHIINWSTDFYPNVTFSGANYAIGNFTNSTDPQYLSVRLEPYDIDGSPVSYCTTFAKYPGNPGNKTHINITINGCGTSNSILWWSKNNSIATWPYVYYRNSTGDIDTLLECGTNAGGVIANCTDPQHCWANYNLYCCSANWSILNNETLTDQGKYEFFLFYEQNTTANNNRSIISLNSGESTGTAFYRHILYRSGGPIMQNARIYSDAANDYGCGLTTTTTTLPPQITHVEVNQTTALQGTPLEVNITVVQGTNALQYAWFTADDVVQNNTNAINGDNLLGWFNTSTLNGIYSVKGYASDVESNTATYDAGYVEFYTTTTTTSTTTTTLLNGPTIDNCTLSSHNVAPGDTIGVTMYVKLNSYPTNSVIFLSYNNTNTEKYAAFEGFNSFLWDTTGLLGKYYTDCVLQETVTNTSSTFYTGWVNVTTTTTTTTSTTLEPCNIACQTSDVNIAAGKCFGGLACPAGTTADNDGDSYCGVHDGVDNCCCIWKPSFICDSNGYPEYQCQTGACVDPWHTLNAANITYGQAYCSTYSAPNDNLCCGYFPEATTTTVATTTTTLPTVFSSADELWQSWVHQIKQILEDQTDFLMGSGDYCQMLVANRTDYAFVFLNRRTVYTDWTDDETLLPQVYYWKVRCRQNGIWSQWSDNGVMNVTTTAPLYFDWIVEK